MKGVHPFKPELYYTLKNYSKEKFTADLMAGIIVGIVALPLAIAFGIASGVSPEKGILTAIIAGFAISAFGGSRVQAVLRALSSSSSTASSKSLVSQGWQSLRCWRVSF